MDDLEPGDDKLVHVVHSQVHLIPIEVEIAVYLGVVHHVDPSRAKRAIVFRELGHDGLRAQAARIELEDVLAEEIVLALDLFFDALEKLFFEILA